MKILTYIPSGFNGFGARVVNAVKNGAASCVIDVVSDHELLEMKLRRLLERPGLAVLSAAYADDLDRLMPLRGLLSGIPVILLLPDDEEETLGRGRLLEPRYVTLLENDLRDLTDVVRKMVAIFSEREQLLREGDPASRGNTESGGGSSPAAADNKN